jgi:hypothetical protein
MHKPIIKNDTNFIVEKQHLEYFLLNCVVFIRKHLGSKNTNSDDWKFDSRDAKCIKLLPEGNNHSIYIRFETETHYRMEFVFREDWKHNGNLAKRMIEEFLESEIVKQVQTGVQADKSWIDEANSILNNGDKQ